MLGVYDVYRAGAALARRLPEPLVDAGAAAVASAAASLRSERRFLVERNLRRVAGPDLPRSELRRQVRRTFMAYARYYVESARLPELDRRRVADQFTAEGFGHIEDGVASGVGPILVLPHLGGWEWAGFWLTEVPGYRVTAVMEPLEPPELHEWFVAYRERLGMEIVTLGEGAAGELMRAIRAGNVICLLSDRDVAGNGVEVEFFGERTTLPAGPATLALRTGAALLPTAVYHEAQGRNHAVIRPPVPAERSDRRLREDVASVTQALAHELEILIRAAPEQWHLMQPNWPSDAAALDRRRRPGDADPDR